MTLLQAGMIVVVNFLTVNGMKNPTPVIGTVITSLTNMAELPTLLVAHVVGDQRDQPRLLSTLQPQLLLRVTLMEIFVATLLQAGTIVVGQRMIANGMPNPISANGSAMITLMITT